MRTRPPRLTRWAAFAAVDGGDYVNVRAWGHHIIWNFHADGSKMMLGQELSRDDMGDK